MTVPVDRSQLKTATSLDHSGDVQKAQAALDSARQQMMFAEGAPEAERFFAQQQADAARFAAEQSYGAASYQQQQHVAEEAFVAQQNQPIEAALRAQEEARTGQILGGFTSILGTGLVAGEVVAAPGAIVAPGLAASAGVGAAFNKASPSDGSEPATTQMTPAILASSRMATPQELGIDPVLDKQLGPVAPAVAVDNVAQASPTVQELLAKAQPIEPAAEASPAPAAPNAAAMLQRQRMAMAMAPAFRPPGAKSPLEG